MPREFRTEKGPEPWLAKQFGMTEHTSPYYQPRTKANILASDLTIIFGETRSPGSKLTLSFCGGLRKMHLVNPAADVLRALDFTGKIVNVAGNKESSNPGIEAYVYRLLIEAWADETEIDRLRLSAPWPHQVPKGMIR